jgi:hypothetical protein
MAIQWKSNEKKDFLEFFTWFRKSCSQRFFKPAHPQHFKIAHYIHDMVKIFYGIGNSAGESKVPVVEKSRDKPEIKAKPSYKKVSSTSDSDGSK